MENLESSAGLFDCMMFLLMLDSSQFCFSIVSVTIQCFSSIRLHDYFVTDDLDQQSSSFDFN